MIIITARLLVRKKDKAFADDLFGFPN